MARPSVNPEPLDTADMQGLVARAYGQLPNARYCLCSVADAVAARAWLGRIAPQVSTAGRRDEGCAAVVAFTAAGLAALGLDEQTLATFPRAFLEGMVTEHRSRILGDVGPNDPANWRWGGPATPAVHVLVALFAPSAEDLEREHATRRAEWAGGLAEVTSIDGLLQGGREHFGFADGLSQPVLRGWPRRTASVQPPAPPPSSTWSEVNPGEVVLGYPDNFEKPSEGPTVAAGAAGAGHLPPAPWARGRRHLGHNGSFLVFRQLTQDVAAFRRLATAAAEASGARGTALSAGLVGAKMVGRWPSGAPVTRFPDADPGEPGTNDFGYHEKDQTGFGCPLGAHVRRSNPRDSSAESPDKALRTSLNHRILRRGRPYGPPLAEGVTDDDGVDRGLLFVCLNVDVERQFEFVQHTWLVNPFFAGLDGEVDPLTGRPDAGARFTVPARPVRRRLDGLAGLVAVVGGGYFFLPGVRALACLASVGA
ncbi:MAG TPA: Dyp-type peroxidase [Acidimicrobiales bacterium]|nr:Dyp-type peroxidase [Acidimicrobiales bacterium]